MFAWEFKWIKNFKPVEVSGVNNGTLKNVNRRMIRKLDKLRSKVGVAFILLSLNQGAHSPGSYHYKNMAVDFRLDSRVLVTSALLYKIVRYAVDLGFRGVGLYKNNSGVWSIHLDLRPKMTVWTARKGANGQWIYMAMEWGRPVT